jgi:hypothetical protein
MDLLLFEPGWLHDRGPRLKTCVSPVGQFRWLNLQCSRSRKLREGRATTNAARHLVTAATTLHLALASRTYQFSRVEAIGPCVPPQYRRVSITVRPTIRSDRARRKSPKAVNLRTCQSISGLASVTGITLRHYLIHIHFTPGTFLVRNRYHHNMIWAVDRGKAKDAP